MSCCLLLEWHRCFNKPYRFIFNNSQFWTWNSAVNWLIVFLFGLLYLKSALFYIIIPWSWRPWKYFFISLKCDNCVNCWKYSKFCECLKSMFDSLMESGLKNHSSLAASKKSIRDSIVQPIQVQLIHSCWGSYCFSLGLGRWQVCS